MNDGNGTCAPTVAKSLFHLHAQSNSHSSKTRHTSLVAPHEPVTQISLAVSKVDL
jgi:hypothetical protein